MRGKIKFKRNTFFFLGKPKRQTVVTVAEYI